MQACLIKHLTIDMIRYVALISANDRTAAVNILVHPHSLLSYQRVIN